MINDENLAQIGESYIQAQQAQTQQAQEKQKEKISIVETQATEKKDEDEFDVKALGNLVCKVMDITFSRIGWEKLNIEEKQALSDSFIGVIRKRIPRVIRWGNEINFGIVIAVIILSRIDISDRIGEYKEEENKDESKKISNSFNSGASGRGKNLFPRRTIKKFK